MREIITLQLGQASNYLATHFWNTQESYFTYGDDKSEPPVDPNIHWRPGLGADGSETFLPRTVIYDLKGGFGSLRQINALYDPGDDPTAALSWEGKSSVHRLPTIAPSAYQQSLDAGETPSELSASNVRYWSDFSRVFFHPRSLNQIYDYELDSTVRPFDKWHLGQELFQTLDKEHELVDRDFRPFVEEADHMQAIQLFTSLDDAWAGFTADYLERMRDEYPKATIWVWGLQPHRPSRLQLANTARSVAAICEQASMLVPLTVPLDSGLPSNVRLDRNSQWHTSALAATALETAGLASRAAGAHGGSRCNLGDLVDRLNTTGKQTLARLQMSVPALTGNAALEPPSIGQLSNKLDAYALAAAAAAADTANNSGDERLDMDFFNLASRKAASRPRRSSRTRTPHVFGQSTTFRATKDEAHEEESVQDEGGGSSRPRTGEHAFHRHYEPFAFPLLDSFPKIYTDQNGQPKTDQVGVTTNLTTDSSVSAAMKELRATVSQSIGLPDREDLSNDIAELAEAYREGWSSGSDDGDDEE